MYFDRQKSPELVAALFAVAYGISTITGCANPKDQSSNAPLYPLRSPEQPPEKISKDAGYPAGKDELAFSLKQRETFNLGGRWELRGESSLVNLLIIPSRISIDLGTKAGLLKITQPLTLRLVDTPVNRDTTGGDTYFNPQTKTGISEIVIPHFLSKLREQEELPNSPLTTSERRMGYLSVLLSQTAVVEISNQAHLQNVKNPLDQNEQKRIDVEANKLGLEYVQQIKNGQASPFIVVTSINQ